MSIIIKGMKMPKHCIDCPMKNDEDDCVVQELQHWRDWDDMKAGCPLVEVPTPHGRLIDADRLLTDRMKSKYYHLPNGDIAIPIIDIEHASTVLEAEVKE